MKFFIYLKYKRNSGYLCQMPQRNEFKAIKRVLQCLKLLEILSTASGLKFKNTILRQKE